MNFQNEINKQTGLPILLQKIVAVMMILLLSPVFILTSIFIRLESQGAAIYSQIRVGERGRRFKIYKFRSMYMPDDPKYVDINLIKSDREGVCKKLFRDPRVSRVGRMIRKYSIDELPQLINVVKGDMVLIGPRPALTQETDQYDYKSMSRLETQPGLTGLWQVSGRADTTFEEQVDLDIRYIKEKSLLTDLKILFATIPVVVFGRGAY